MRTLPFVILLFVLITIEARGQEYLIESKSATIVYEVPDLSKKDLFTSISSWFAEQESTSEFTVESSDESAGSIVLTEVNQVFYKNIGKLMYPNRSGMAELLSGDFDYRIEIAVEEGSYLVVYTLTGMSKEMYGRDELFFNCIDFEEIDDLALEEYNKSMNKLLKMNAVFKKRRTIFLDNTRDQFQDVSQNILNGMTGNMGSLYGHLTLK